jgi:hypothetical protein
MMSFFFTGVYFIPFQLLRNRKVRVDLADQNQQGDDRGGGNKGGDPDRTEDSDWRRKPDEEG